jgi:segregation and condensation protein B
MEEDIIKLEASIEAILFAMGEAVTVEQLAMALEHDEATVRKVVHHMMDRYDEEDRGIRIIEIEDGFQLCTKNEYYEVLSKIVNIPKKHMLTDVQLETLSIIAYKQPITRTEIEAIRGVSCVHAINKLLEYHLIEEVGRLDALGKPILFGTTEDFLRGFGVKSTDELPIITPDKIADFEQQALEEASITLDT